MSLTLKRKMEESVDPGKSMSTCSSSVVNWLTRKFN